MPQTSPPPLSVVMPARNVLLYVDASIASILGQSFGDFELIVRDDGSTDGTGEALRAWAARDRRIRLFEGPRLGLAGSANWVVGHARAPLVARMDADDVARPDRLERQMDVLRRAPDVVLAASLFDTIDSRGRQIRPAEYWRIVRRSCFVPFAHSSVMFRRAAFDAIGGYRSQCEYWEDLDLFLRLAARGRIAVIADDLVSHRQSAASARQVPEDEERIEAAVDRMFGCLEAFARGESYEPLVAAGPEPVGLRPIALVSIHSNRLWSRRPTRIAARLLRRARLGLDWQTLLALVWAGFAQTAPGLLRTGLRGLVHLRNFALRGAVERGAVYDWQPFVRPRPDRRGAQEAAAVSHAPVR